MNKVEARPIFSSAADRHTYVLESRESAQVSDPIADKEILDSSPFKDANDYRLQVLQNHGLEAFENDADYREAVLQNRELDGLLSDSTDNQPATAEVAAKPSRLRRLGGALMSVFKQPEAERSVDRSTKRRRWAIGGAALALAGGLFGGAAVSHDTAPREAGTITTEAPVQAGAEPTIEVDAAVSEYKIPVNIDAARVDPGEGGLQTMREAGVDPAKAEAAWQDAATKIDAAMPGVVYKQGNEYRWTDAGELPSDAAQIVQTTANQNK